MRREIVKITLSGAVASEVTRRAETCGLPVSRWASEVIEAFVAGERCRHGEARPEAPEAADDPPEPDA